MNGYLIHKKVLLLKVNVLSITNRFLIKIILNKPRLHSFNLIYSEFKVRTFI